MTTIERHSVMAHLEGLFDRDGYVSRSDAEGITGLSERSIPEAYFLETEDHLVKINTYDIPAACSSFPHTKYVRVKDLNKMQVVAYSKWLREHREGTVASDDSVLQQLEARKDELLSA